MNNNKESLQHFQVRRGLMLRLFPQLATALTLAACSAPNTPEPLPPTETPQPQEEFLELQFDWVMPHTTKYLHGWFSITNLDSNINIGSHRENLTALENYLSDEGVILPQMGLILTDEYGSDEKNLDAFVYPTEPVSLEEIQWYTFDLAEIERPDDIQFIVNHFISSAIANAIFLTGQMDQEDAQNLMEQYPGNPFLFLDPLRQDIQEL